MAELEFAKGHGAENDFVLLVDPDNNLSLDADQVRWICDRRAGIGADGILRAVRAGQMSEWSGAADVWFMDYRNADGSVAEMCGNGIRVFVRHLIDQSLVAGPLVPIATRSGLRMTQVLPDGQIRVAMGLVRVSDADVRIQTRDNREFAAVAVDVGNPHAVSFCAEPGELDLTESPSWQPQSVFPSGVNAEFVTQRAPQHLSLRVYERGSGETRCCGTGTVAAAAAWHTRIGADLGWPADYRVDCPGGTVRVELTDSQHGTEAQLTGPAVIVATGRFELR